MTVARRADDGPGGGSVSGDVQVRAFSGKVATKSLSPGFPQHAEASGPSFWGPAL